MMRDNHVSELMDHTERKCIVNMARVLVLIVYYVVHVRQTCLHSAELSVHCVQGKKVSRLPPHTQHVSRSSLIRMRAPVKVQVIEVLEPSNTAKGIVHIEIA